MKNLKNTLFLITFALFVNQVFAMEMGGMGKQEKEEEEKQPYPTPEVTFFIKNETENNFFLMQNEEILGQIKAKSTHSLPFEIPMQLMKKYEDKIIFSGGTLQLIRENKEYPIILYIAKNKIGKIEVVCTLEKFLTQAEQLDEFKKLLNLKTDQEAQQMLEKMKKMGMSFKEGKTSVVTLQDAIDVDNLEKIQDHYSIKLLLKGDDLADSEIDYAASIR